MIQMNHKLIVTLYDYTKPDSDKNQDHIENLFKVCQSIQLRYCLTSIDWSKPPIAVAEDIIKHARDESLVNPDLRIMEKLAYILYPKGPEVRDPELTAWQKLPEFAEDFYKKYRLEAFDFTEKLLVKNVDDNEMSLVRLKCFWKDKYKSGKVYKWSCMPSCVELSYDRFSHFLPVQRII